MNVFANPALDKNPIFGPRFASLLPHPLNPMEETRDEILFIPEKSGESSE